MAAIKERDGTSYQIDGAYFGKPAFQDIKQLDANLIKSMGSKRIGTFSYGYGENPIYHSDNDSENEFVGFRTSSNYIQVPKSDFEKYGNFFGNDDKGMEGWLKAGEDVNPSMFDEVPSYPEWLVHNHGEAPQGIIEGKAHILNLPHPRDTKTYLYVTPINYLISAFNDVGKWISKSENMRQLVINHSQDYRTMNRGEPNPETLAYSAHLAKNKFGEPYEMDGYGVMDMPDKSAIAATRHHGKGHVYLIINDNFYEHVQRKMEAYGIEGRVGRDLLIDSIFNHERTHFFKKGSNIRTVFGRIKVEKLVGRMLEEFYESRAKSAGEEDAAAYRTLAKDNRHYRSWIGKALFREWLFGKEAKESHKHLEAILTAEAIALGMDEGEIESYVSSKIAEYESRESLTRQITDSKSDKSSLESRVESSEKPAKGRKAAKGKEKGRAYESISKMQVYEKREADEDSEKEQETEENDKDADESDGSDGESPQGESGSNSE